MACIALTLQATHVRIIAIEPIGQHNRCLFTNYLNSLFFL